MTDPITDMFNRIRNAEMADHPKTSIPFSRVKFQLAEILKKYNFILDVKKRGRTIKKTMLVSLKYGDDKHLTITQFKRISKPGQRIYQASRDIKKIKNGFGISIISTPEGIMTGMKAKKKKIGGELMVEVW